MPELTLSESLIRSMADGIFIASRLAEAGITADKDTLDLVEKIVIHGRTGFKDREIMSLSADLTNLAGKTAVQTSANLIKTYSKAITSATENVGKALGAAGAILAIATMIFNLVSELQDRAETNEIAQRHLQGLDTATGLQPESIRIVAAVKQIVERGFDQHELRSINAEGSVTVEFLSKTIIPLAQNIDGMDIQTIHNYRERLHRRIDINRRDLHVHLQRFSAGITSMSQQADLADYQIETNHLARYSKACTLDAYLSFYELLLSNRLRDGLVEHNLECYSSRNRSALSVIQQHLEGYTEARVRMIKTNYYYDAGAALHRDCVRDAASHNDKIIGPIPLSDIAHSGIDWNGCGMNHEDGVCKFWSAIWENRTHPAAQRTKHAAMRYIRESTKPETGEVWNNLVGKPQKAMSELEERITAIIFCSKRDTTRANLRGMEDCVLESLIMQAQTAPKQTGWLSWW
ncbi:hypothetical protein D6D01_00836 [Aureobasidium pullulans]|uniref:Uncharacterized protein n=1 Tax=Aureobasidium pullulans TaxID=5580 RepID=A0A4S9M0X6_AURPU|nr:hypothetical protein D6D01_00836 [Aureobasidium pullulans]